MNRDNYKPVANISARNSPSVLRYKQYRRCSEHQADFGATPRIACKCTQTCFHEIEKCSRSMADTISPQTASNSFSYRNVSACNRCRLRKNRCDQQLPACSSCEKAGVRCVGYDPITKRDTTQLCVLLGG